MGSHLCL